jgi:hypothetical protein
MDLAQSDAAAAFDWYRSESHMAYARPEDVVTGNKADGYQRRPVATAGMREGVRYQIYESSDGHVLFMASEQAFWKNFCAGVGSHGALREMARLEVRRPRARQPRTAGRAAHHLQEPHDAARIGSKFSVEANTPIAPVNTPQNHGRRPAVQGALQESCRTRQHGADMLGFPVQFVGEELPAPAIAPTAGRAHRRRCCATCSATTRPGARRSRKPAHWADGALSNLAQSGTGSREHLRGHCLCGEVRYEATGPAGDMWYCHCGNCCKSSGAVGVWIETRGVRWLSGEDRVVRRATSPTLTRAFCSQCGTVLPAQRAGDGGALLPAGGLENVGRPAPRRACLRQRAPCRGYPRSMRPCRCCTSLANRLHRPTLRGSMQPGRPYGAAACAARSPGKSHRPSWPCASVTARAVGAARAATDSSA